MHGILFFGNMKNQIRLKNKISFATSDISTYSACVVNSVMHFWVCEYHETGPPAHNTTPGHRPTVSRLARVVSIRKWNQMKPFYCSLWNVFPKLLVLSAYPKIKSAAFQWTICGARQYLATTLTAFAISVLVNKAIHKSAPINSRKGKRTIGSSTSKS